MTLSVRYLIWGKIERMPKGKMIKTLLGGDVVKNLLIEELRRQGNIPEAQGVTIEKIVVNMIGPVLMPDESGMLIYSKEEARITTFTLSIEVNMKE